MRKFIPALFLFLFSAFTAYAQSTTVSGQVTDAGAQSWNNGTIVFTFSPNPQYPVGPYTWTGGIPQHHDLWNTERQWCLLYFPSREHRNLPHWLEMDSTSLLAGLLAVFLDIGHRHHRSHTNF